MAKSQKGKKNRTKNIYPHILSRGEYDKLENIQIKERKKQREHELEVPPISLDHSPSSSSHHKEWKIASQRPGGKFTLEVTTQLLIRL